MRRRYGPTKTLFILLTTTTDRATTTRNMGGKCDNKSESCFVCSALALVASLAMFCYVLLATEADLQSLLVNSPPPPSKKIVSYKRLGQDGSLEPVTAELDWPPVLQATRQLQQSVPDDEPIDDVDDDGNLYFYRKVS